MTTSSTLHLPEGFSNISFTSGKLDNEGSSEGGDTSCSGLGKPSCEVTSANDLSGLGGNNGSMKLINIPINASLILSLFTLFWDIGRTA